MRYIKKLLGITQLEKSLKDTNKSIEHLSIALFEIKHPLKFFIGDNVKFASMLSQQKQGIVVDVYCKIWNGRPCRFYNIYIGDMFCNGVAEYDILGSDLKEEIIL